MRTNPRTLLLASLGVVAGVFGFSSESHAVLTSCPASFTADGTAKVTDGTGTQTAASSCQFLEPADQNNVANISNINTAGFFGQSDWESNSQTQIDPPNDASGTWTIANVDFSTYDYIIVFKDGNGTNLIAFLFNEEFSSGNWTTPFTDPPFNLPGNSRVHDVSHYTIARRQAGGTQVPEPLTLALVGSGLVGIGMLKRRRR